MHRRVSLLLAVLGTALLHGACNAIHAPEEEVPEASLTTQSAAQTSLTGTMVYVRTEHAAALLADGRVLVAGGGNHNFAAISFAETYNPSTGSWSITSSMSTSRRRPTATALGDGRVLVVGGVNAAGTALSSAETYSPSTGVWTLTGGLSASREFHTATLLDDGRVLVAGGGTGGAELFDPSSNTFLPAGTPLPRRKHTATLLPGGKVLVLGGEDPSTGTRVTSVEEYDPATNAWSVVGTLTGRAGHTATLLPSGAILLAGGTRDTTPELAELYDPTTHTASPAGTLSGSRRNHTAHLLSNGDVLLVNGVGPQGDVSSVERYTPGTGTWSLTDRTFIPRRDFTATLLASGKLLIAGGFSESTLATSGNFAVAELYTPTATTCVPRTCSAMSYQCGAYLDDCGRPADCGTCSATQSCFANRCEWNSNARHDGALKTPRCPGLSASCDSGNLLYGRGSTLGPEANQPNTLDSCADGLSGTYRVQPSLEQLRVSSMDFGTLTEGKTVQVTAYLYGGSTYSSFRLDLFSSGSATSPAWTHVASLTPTASGYHSLSTTFVLPAGSLQAIRGHLHFGTTVSTTCTAPGIHDERDDLVFPVSSGVDTVAPTTSLTAPVAGAVVRGTVTLSANASDNFAVTRVEFYAGTTLLGTDTSSPYSLSWDSRGVPNGGLELTTRAYDAAGFVGTSAPVPVTVDNDYEAPSVSFTAPAEGATVSGTVTLAASASDNLGVTRVEFFEGTTSLGSDTSAPFTASWNTVPGSNGARTVTARAYDAAGNVSTAASVTVMADNDKTAPVIAITSPAAGTTVRGVVTVTADATDNVGVTRVDFYDNVAFLGSDTTPPYSVQWDTALNANGSRSVYARAYDANGNLGTSTQVAVTADNDKTPPAVSITAPVSGATVSGTVTISASASDNVGVASVEFIAGGVTLSTDTTAPYSATWNTALLANGTYTLYAKARDGSYNVTLSSSVTVTVSNGPPPSTTAVYDSTRRAPKCGVAVASCDSGTLLNGRAHLGPESNAPNTINGTCQDGTGGSYHYDESLDRLQVSTLDGTPLAPGKTVRITATAWVWGAGSDRLDLYYAADANNPVWTFLTTLAPSASGSQTLTATYTLPSGALQAVRGNFRYGGSASPCSGGSYDDRDDLIFATW